MERTSQALHEGSSEGMWFPAQRDCASVGCRLALLASEIGIGLSEDEASAFLATFREIEKAETITDDERRAIRDGQKA